MKWHGLHSESCIWNFRFWQCDFVMGFHQNSYQWWRVQCLEWVLIEVYGVRWWSASLNCWSRGSVTGMVKCYYNSGSEMRWLREHETSWKKLENVKVELLFHWWICIFTVFGELFPWLFYYFYQQTKMVWKLFCQVNWCNLETISIQLPGV